MDKPSKQEDWQRKMTSSRTRDRGLAFSTLMRLLRYFNGTSHKIYINKANPTMKQIFHLSYLASWIEQTGPH
jgi:hypothetical protein